MWSTKKKLHICKVEITMGDCLVSKGVPFDTESLTATHRIGTALIP